MSTLTRWEGTHHNAITAVKVDSSHQAAPAAWRRVDPAAVGAYGGQMDADIEATRRDIERQWNEETSGIIWPPELRDDAADWAIERRWNERHKGRHLVRRTELSDDIPGWVTMRPVPPEGWDGDPEEYWVLGPMCLVRIQDRAEVNLYWDSPCWLIACAVIRERGETATADEIQTELYHRWKDEEERRLAKASAQRRERWKFWKRA